MRRVMNTWSRQSSSSYSGAERRIDAVVQSVATALSVGAVTWLVFTSWQTNTFPGLAIYGFGLVATFASSFIYTHLASGSSKELWRRVDHAVIFALIAGTYTPLAAYRLPEPWSVTILALVWSAALVGMFLKFAYPRRFEYAGLALCIVIGLTGIFFFRQLLQTVTPLAFARLVAGIVLYLLGTVMLQLHRLRFHNAIWHLLVLAAAGVHFLAIAKEFVGR